MLIQMCDKHKYIVGTKLCKALSTELKPCDRLTGLTLLCRVNIA